LESKARLTADVTSQARSLMVAVYTNRGEDFDRSNLANVRVYKFLNNKSTLLKLLPPTEDAFLQHLKRAALATLIDKSSHISKPSLPPYDDFGWALEEDKLVPVASTQPAWPQQMTKAISCNCTKGCNRNCSCAKKKIPCYIGCCCQGSISKCSHAQCTAALESEDNASDSDS